jgi:hypothetical protein
VTIAAELDAIETQIEDLQHELESCRKAMLVSRIAIVGGALVLAAVLTVAGAYRTPAIVFSAFAATIGGIIWLGASKSSSDEKRDALATLDAAKNRMIDRVAAENGWRDMTPTVH